MESAALQAVLRLAAMGGEWNSVGQHKRRGKSHHYHFRNTEMPGIFRVDGPITAERNWRISRIDSLVEKNPPHPC